MSIVLNGSTQSAERATGLVTAYPYSLVAWIKPDLNTSADNIIFCGDTAASDEYTLIKYSGQRGGDPARAFASSLAAGSSNAEDATTGLAGAWHQIVGIFASATSRKIIVDDDAPVEATASVTPLFADFDVVNVGRFSGSSKTNYFDGKIAYAAVYNIALSGPDVLDLQTSSPASVQAASLLALWTFRTDSNDANDSSVNGNDLTLLNTPTFDSGDNPSLSGAGIIPLIMHHRKTLGVS